ncbi:MAG: cytochrome b/b6 domain-containing protein [Firmicutes bacterium]|nr:cytochrome b/b6 domain-containing protein [Bacillota bacterium]
MEVSSPASTVSQGDAVVERWNRQERWQHGLLALSTAVLIITGFAIKYRHTFWAPGVVAAFGGFRNLFYAHLTAAVLLFISIAYHLVYLVCNYRPRRDGWPMMPTWQDVRDCIHHLKYLAGLEKERPHFGRYTYLEKFEYWAVGWGIVIMGISGLVLWFPEIAGRWFPYWVIEAFRVAHSNEAFVCFFAVAVGHFFAAHFAPGVFPMSTVWLDGKISLERLKEEHPAEYEELVKRPDFKPQPAQGRVVRWQRRWAENPVLLFVELIPYLGIVIWSLATFVPLLLS